jgi:protein-disulfide isomerase
LSRSGKRRSGRRAPARKAGGGAVPPAKDPAGEDAAAATTGAKASRDSAPAPRKGVSGAGPSSSRGAPPGRGVFAKLAPWAGATALVVLAVVVLYLFTGAAATETSKAAPLASTDITYGPENPELTVIEYSDFQCPFCAEYAKWLTELRAKYGDRVQFVFRNYPLSNHEWATLAAKVGYAASLQGKFWEMHDLLFQRQDEWAASSDPRPLFDSYAESLGLDMDKFHADADAQSTLDFIKKQAAEGKKAGVTHTPWFVIGDKSVLPRSLEQFDKAIQEALR